MGVSNRMNKVIEPHAGDLLLPDRGRRFYPARSRDAEDASFETVSAARDVFSERRPGATHAASVFKTRIVQPDGDGPVPRDFAGSATSSGGRLDVFAAAAWAPGRSIRKLVFPVTLCAVTAVSVFWMAGGHALVAGSQVLPSAATPAATSLATRASLLPPQPSVQPEVNAAIDQSGDGNGFAAPTPRPARIERAGSILMIRPTEN